MNLLKKFNNFLEQVSVIKNQYEPLKKLKEIQWRKLKIMIEHAYKNVPYYMELFKKANILPDEIKSFEDMLRVPISQKESLSANFPDKVIARGYTEKDYIHDHTSGTTGLSFAYIVDKRAIRVEELLGARVESYANIKATDTYAYINPMLDNVFRVNSPNFKQRTHCFLFRKPFNSLEISPWASVQEQVNILEKYHPDIIKGFASSLYAIARRIQEVNTQAYHRICFSTSEFLSEEHRKFIEDIMHTTVYRIYGSREFGELGAECLEFSGYHLNIDGFYIEVVKNAHYCQSDEMGEIIITDLNNFAMPFIRYRVGDIGIVSDERCKCGRTLPLLKEIIGKTYDMVTAPSGEIIVPEYFTKHWRKIKGLKQAQIIQEKKNLIVLKLVVSGDFKKDEVLRILERSYRKKMGDIKIKYEFVDKIEREKSGKYRVVKSKIPINFT